MGHRSGPADIDWKRIAQLYHHLAQLVPTPVVRLNRAVAVAMSGPAPGWPDMSIDGHSTAQKRSMNLKSFVAWAISNAP
jgi:predicted RNA polymerase sigma factor